MDKSRLSNDMTEKNKSNQNRSIVGKNDSHEFLANKGGGDGTGIGGSSADGKDMPGMFIFSKNIIHGEDVSEKPHCMEAGTTFPSTTFHTNYRKNMPCGSDRNEYHLLISFERCDGLVIHLLS